MRAAPLFLALLASTAAADAAPRIYTLPELVKLADTGNEDLAAVREKVSQALLGIDKAYAVLWPTLEIGGAYTRNSVEASLGFPDFTSPWNIQPTAAPDPNTGQIPAYLIPTNLVETVIQPHNQFGAQLRLAAPIFVMPAYEGIGIAKQAARATALGVAHGRDEICFGIAQAYYGAYGAQRLVALTRAQLDSALAQERLAGAKAASGQAPRLELLRAATDRARAEQDVRRAENTHRTALLAIAMLTGAPLPFDVAPPPPDERPAAGAAEELVTAALSSRQDLAANRAAVDIARRAVDATWSRFLPVVAANADLRHANVAGFTGENTTWLVQLAASMTLYDESRYVAMDEARSRVREAEASARAAERRVAQEVQAALLELESARANVVKAQEQERLAEEAVQLAKASYEAGAATALVLSDATTARLGAGIASVAEGLAVQLAGLKLAKSLGRLGEVLPVPPITIPPAP